MRFDVVTLFPGMFNSPLDESILKRALVEGLIEVGLHNLRDYTHDRHRVVDDAPYGGGSGMVLKPEPVVEAIEDLRREGTRVILLAPSGRRFDQREAQRLAGEKHLLLLCGRYEGMDERVLPYVDEVLSIGDYVLTGGELAALAVIDTVARLIPGVLGSEGSTEEESFSWDILEYPHYTRPRSFRGWEVPEVLLSGNHEAIRVWRREAALRKTLEARPDLLTEETLTAEDRRLLGRITPEGDKQAL